MTAATLAPVPARATAWRRTRAWLWPLVLLAALAAIVGARWCATRLGLDALAVGAGFGVALGAVAIVARTPARRQSPRTAVMAVVLGTAAGLALVAITVAGALAVGPMVPGLGRPAAPFAPWALITILVASGEEALLRGALFDRIRRAPRLLAAAAPTATRPATTSAAAGTLAAVAVTTVAFALLHVPLYGWHVVPLDLAVGLLFAGLRLGTGTVVAPAAAHTVADLATWWL